MAIQSDSRHRKSTKKGQKRSNKSNQLLVLAGVGAAVMVLLVVNIFIFGRNTGNTGDTTRSPGVRWMLPDPAVESVDWSNALQTEIPVPQKSEFRLFLPFTPSPFVGADPFVGFKPSGAVSVYDVRTNQRVHHIQFPSANSTMTCLSPDGKIIGLCDGRQFHFWSTESGRQLVSTNPIPEGAECKWGGFRSPTEFIYVFVRKIGRNRVMEGAVVDPVAGQGRTLSLPGSLAESMQYSPGGRYLAYLGSFRGARHNQIVAFDLQTGQSVGNAGTFADMDPVEVQAITFSADGKQVAVLAEIVTQVQLNLPVRLIVRFLDVATGNMTRDITVSDIPVETLKKRDGLSFLNWGARDLRWLPDGKHLIIYNLLVVDAASGKVVGDLTERDTSVIQSFFCGNSMIKQLMTNDGSVFRSQKIELQ